MKVSMGTVEMTDVQRKELADVLDGKVSSRKASRDEARDFIWSHGKDWSETLADMVSDDSEPSAEDDSEPSAEDDSEPSAEDDDLIGAGGDSDDPMDLI